MIEKPATMRHICDPAHPGWHVSIPVEWHQGWDRHGAVPQAKGIKGAEREERPGRVRVALAPVPLCLEHILSTPLNQPPPVDAMPKASSLTTSRRLYLPAPELSFSFVLLVDRSSRGPSGLVRCPVSGCEEVFKGDEGLVKHLRRKWEIRKDGLHVNHIAQSVSYATVATAMGKSANPMRKWHLHARRCS